MFMIIIVYISSFFYISMPGYILYITWYFYFTFINLFVSLFIYVLIFILIFIILLLLLLFIDIDFLCDVIIIILKHLF